MPLILSELRSYAKKKSFSFNNKIWNCLLANLVLLITAWSSSLLYQNGCHHYQENENYRREYAVFTNYLKSRGITIRSPNDFQKFIMRTGRDPLARKALLSRNNALRIVLNSEAKIDVLGKYLTLNSNLKSLIFTRYNELVYKISRRFLIPAITHKTPKDERREILDKFKKGFYKSIVTSQVLDEGIDVPDASLGFILGGTGSSREYIQRLGRLLRKKKDKEAKLIEFVAKETIETKISQRRHG